ncbi:hypothetical protein TSUD_34420 [Trifolium subterraneum]|uniref:Reverse transcriptase zinc-binding domain-containing protein n=1 Tax=Trifolium subterraneum TaxID=3900 RepID=A0A2Z6NDN5_TRISU|nr:hypothetical protein TSUD_34420 [Trifolium subterraneum]
MNTHKNKLFFGVEVDLGGIRASYWWKDINSIRFETDGGAESWLVDNVVKQLGDEEKTLFWKDKWVDGILLKSQFGRLFDLSLDKEVTVADMCTCRWEVASPDVWEWIPDYNTDYSVDGTCHLLTRMYARVVRHLRSTILFGTSLYHQQFSLLLGAGCDAIKDIHHLFLNCLIFCAVWKAIISWLRITCVLPDNAVSLASQFCGAHDFSKSYSFPSKCKCGGGLRQGKKVFVLI